MNSARRLAFQYAFIFAANGVSLPFAGLWLRAQGLTGAQIGVLLAAPMLGRLVTGPLIALWADGFQARRTPIAILGATAAIGYGCAGLGHGFLVWSLSWCVAATAASAMIPLTDVMTLRLARRLGFTFAVPRGFGSAAFVLANVAMGVLLTRVSVDAVIVWVVVGCGLSAILAAWGLPADPVHDGQAATGRQRFAGLGRLVSDPVFLTAIFAIGCIQATHAFYYGFSAIAWKAQGLSETTTGLLWAFSVGVEIAFMWVIEPWRRRSGIGPWPMLALGGVAAVVRWTALAFAPPLWMLWPLQSLHALSFAATYLAGVQIVERLSPPDSQTAAQTLASVLSSGVLIGLATLVSGTLYDAFGLAGYLSMTALAMIGLMATLRIRQPLATPADA